MLPTCFIQALFASSNLYIPYLCVLFSQQMLSGLTMHGLRLRKKSKSKMDKSGMAGGLAVSLGARRNAKHQCFQSPADLLGARRAAKQMPPISTRPSATSSRRSPSASTEMGLATDPAEWMVSGPQWSTYVYFATH